MEVMIRSCLLVFVVSHFFLLNVVLSDESSEKEEKEANEKWKKKDVLDYTEADIERLYEQWEDGEEPLEDDELPEWKRPQPKIDLSKLNPNDPEGMLKMSKQGRTLMMFATVSGNPTEKETETITQLWQSSLFNAHYDVQRYVVGGNRILFLLKDGAKAWEVKDFLIRQERCESVTIEGKDYPGRGAQGSGAKEVKDSERDSKKSSKTDESKEHTASNPNEKSKSGTSEGHEDDKESERTREDL